MPSAPNNVHQVYQLNWGVFCTLTRSDIVTICTFCLVKHVDLIAYLLLACVGNQSQQTTIIIVKYALVGERIGGWYSILKARSNILMIALVMKYLKLCYDSVWSMCGCWWHICYRSLLAILRKKVGEPREESRNLYGFHVNSYNL